jgi:hypothetical protein
MGEMTDEMRLYPSALLKILIPAALICAAYVGLQYIQLLDAESRVILQNLPYLFCLVAIIMANQFNRGRLLLAALGIGVFFWTVQN